MPWTKLDDKLWANPKTTALPPASGWAWVRMLSFVADQKSDGWISETFALMLAGKPAVVRDLVTRGFLETDRPGPTPEPGYWIHDYLDWNKSRAELADRAAHVVARRSKTLTSAVRRRDGNQCRYCGKTPLNWKDRKGPDGGTYDKVRPGIAEGPGNLVVACRSCNSRKKDRKPEDVGMTLRDRPLSPIPEPDWDLDDLAPADPTDLANLDAPDPSASADEGSAPGTGPGSGPGPRSEGPAPTGPPTEGDPPC